jgi:hypothetical protein
MVMGLCLVMTLLPYQPKASLKILIFVKLTAPAINGVAKASTQAVKFLKVYLVRVRKTNCAQIIKKLARYASFLSPSRS